jgi:hypothetical protein
VIASGPLRHCSRSRHPNFEEGRRGRPRVHPLSGAPFTPMTQFASNGVVKSRRTRSSEARSSISALIRNQDGETVLSQRQAWNRSALGRPEIERRIRAVGEIHRTAASRRISFRYPLSSSMLKTSLRRSANLHPDLYALHAGSEDCSEKPMTADARNRALRVGLVPRAPSASGRKVGQCENKRRSLASINAAMQNH